MAEKRDMLSFEAAMLDWAEAEMQSPIGWELGYSYLGAEIRERLITNGIDRLGSEDRQLVLAAHLHFRKPLLRTYQINRSCHFLRHTLELYELARLEILPLFGLGPVTLTELAERLQARSVPGHEEVWDVVEQMKADARSGKSFSGRPIIFDDGDASRPALLIEGYKRCLVKLSLGERSPVEVVLVRSANTHGAASDGSPSQ